MYRNYLKNSSIFALTAAFLSLPATASAADIYGRDNTTPQDAYQQAAPSHSWTGLWLGAVGGYQFSNSAVDFNAKEVQGDEGSETVPLGGTEKSFGLSLDGLGAEGFFGEAQLGYDKQIGQRTVVGVFGGFNLNNAEFSLDASAFNAWDDPQSESANILSFEQEWGGVLGARVGLLKSQDTMFYLAGGWAFGEMGEVKSGGAPVFADQETDLSGWFGEVGMESRIPELGNNVYLTVAGRYTDYGAITLDSNSDVGGCGNDTCSYNLELDHDTLAVMVGLKAKLGGLGN